MKNLLSRTLLLFACFVIAGSIAILIYFPELSKTQKIFSMVLIFGMTLVSASLIQREFRKREINKS